MFRPAVAVLKRPDRADQMAVKPASDQAVSAGGLDLPRYHEAADTNTDTHTHADGGAGAHGCAGARSCAHTGCRRFPNPDHRRQADIADGQEHPSLRGSKCRVVEHAWHRDGSLPAVTRGCVCGQSDARLSHGRCHLGENMGRRENSPAADGQIAIPDRNGFPGQADDTLDGGRAIRRRENPALVPLRPAKPIEQRTPGGSNDIARQQSGRHRQAIHLIPSRRYERRQAVEHRQATEGRSDTPSRAQPHPTVTHWWLLALDRTASQTFWVSSASRKVGWAGCFFA